MSVPYLNITLSRRSNAHISPELDVSVEVDELLKVVLSNLLTKVELSRHPEEMGSLCFENFLPPPGDLEIWTSQGPMSDPLRLVSLSNM